MYTTTAIIFILSILSCSDGILFKAHQGPLLNSLRVKWSLLGPLGGFYTLSTTAENARRKGYVTPPEEEGSSTDVQVLCPNKDPTVCLLFDKHGHIAGLEIGIQRSQVANTGYPFEKHPVYQPKTRFGIDIHATALFFIEQATLNAGGRTGLSTKSATSTGLWIQNGPNRNSLFEVPRLEKDIKKTPYIKQKCVPTMGTHYYYNMTKNLPCEELYPIFTLYRHGEMIGFGYQIYGTYKPLGKTTWFEEIPRILTRPRLAIPDAPDCLVDNTFKYGTISLHVFFINNPLYATCLS